MSRIELTPEERETGTLSPDKRELAVQSVKVDGYALFERVLPPELTQRLLAEFLQAFDAYVARTDPNRGANRYQMHLPFRPPFADPAVIENPLAISVLDGLLGKDYICHYFASDTPLPGSDYQRVHSDIPLLFPEMPLSLPAYSVVVNIPLVDHTPENGPLEIWPGGTHLMPGGTDLQALAPGMRSERVPMPAGSLLVRDMRMWHRGTPNRSGAPRPNLALIYSRPWLKLHYPPIDIPAAVYGTLSPSARRLFRLENIPDGHNI